MARSDVPAAGPTGRNPRQLAAELSSLAMDPRVAVHRTALIELAGDITNPERLARWSGTDLVAVYSAPGTLLNVPEPIPPAVRARGAPPARSAAGSEGWRARRQRWARTFAGWAGALVFLPLLVTWAGLGAAAWAYQKMREAGKGGGESFLGLWQQGFAGELWAPFHFDVMVLYTVLALGGLIAATRLRSRQESADERATGVFAARLAGALVQVQALASGAAHMTPLRFAEELQGAAGNLRTLGELAGSVQRETRELVEQARETATLTRSAAEALGAAVAGLQKAAAAVETSAGHASQAAEGAGRGADVLSHEVVKVLGEMGQRVRESAHAAAGELSAAATDAVRRIEEAADDASAHEEDAVRRGVELLDRTAGALGGTLDGARTALEFAAVELGGATEQLNGTVAALPQALEGAAADGAERIGWAYDRAVAALVVSLRGEVRAVTGELASQMVQLQELAGRRENAELAARVTRAETEEGLRSAVDEFRRTLEAVAASVEVTTERLARSGPVHGPPEPPVARSEWPSAVHGVEGPELPYDASGPAPIGADEYPAMGFGAGVPSRADDPRASFTGLAPNDQTGRAYGDDQPEVSFRHHGPPDEPAPGAATLWAVAVPEGTVSGEHRSVAPSVDRPRDEGHTGWDEWYSEDPDDQSTHGAPAARRAPTPLGIRATGDLAAEGPRDAVPADSPDDSIRGEVPEPAPPGSAERNGVDRPWTGSAASSGEEGP
ncbi:hypothetical protein ABZ348_29320 [Streptomyces sp. NPDC005963]|uniref:hypothetical protein n=1 Tax=Streptomyces sp. NPDC005963 TaxID=3156721 RepID=UPI00340226CF